jgi:hypothetical protein
LNSYLPSLNALISAGPKEMVEMVKEVKYFMKEDFADGVFESCHNVYSPALSAPALVSNQHLCFIALNYFFKYLKNLKI